MTFIIRQVTKRTGGQDIIRDRTVEAEKITVGRATGNDLFLTDLRVGLEHLEISLSGSRVHIEALNEKNFILGGRAVSTATIGNGPKDILVGPYQLRFDRDDSGVWMIEVTRVEPEERINPEQVDEIFSLRGTLLKKRLPVYLAFLTVMAVFLAFPLAWFFGVFPDSVNEKLDADQVWLSGPMSSGHAKFQTECEECHKTAFEHVTDGTCVECHDDVVDHADPHRLVTAQGMPSGFGGLVTKTATFFGKEQGECADCHREHNGDAGIVLTASTLCTDCHKDMSSRLTDTRLEDVSDFGREHGNFRALLVTEPGDPPSYARVGLDDPEIKDNSGLKFPHDLHLDATGGVAKQAQELGAEFGFGAKLECEDCHTRESGGALFETVTMEANCQMCHSLIFETDGTVERKLPHGEPQEVIAILREFYRGRALGVPSRGGVITERRRPGSTSSLRTEDRRAAVAEAPVANAEAMVARVFSEGGSCYDCHEVIPAPAGTIDYDIVSVTLVDQFMVAAKFDHDKHETGDMDCQTCHDAEGSERASDVLLPGIETRTSALTNEPVTGCRDCHGGEKARGDMVASDCVSCHGYHEGDEPVGDKSAGIGRLAFDPHRWKDIP